MRQEPKVVSTASEANWIQAVKRNMETQILPVKLKGARHVVSKHIFLKGPLHSAPEMNSLLLGSCPTENSKWLLVRKFHPQGPAELQVSRNMFFENIRMQKFFCSRCVLFCSGFCSCFCLLASLPCFVFFHWGKHSRDERGCGGLGGEQNWEVGSADKTCKFYLTLITGVPPQNP